MAGTEVLNGTQLPLDAAYILNLLAGNKLTERGQDIGWNDRLLTYYERERDAKQAWERDAAQLGIEAANLNFQQRQADAQNELQRQGGVLGRDELNFRQRDAAAGKKLGILDMLNSRRGPSNWVRYDSLLEGLDPPKADRTATIDPYAILEGLVQNSDAFSEKIGSVNVPHSVSMGSAPSSGAPASLLQQTRPMSSGLESSGGGGGAASPASAQSLFNWSGAKTNNPAGNISGQGPGDIFSGVRNEDVAGLGSGQSALKYTGTAGPSYGRDYAGFKVSDPAKQRVYGPDDEIPGGSALWITRLGEGGMASAPAMALTGDGTGEKPNPDSELVMALLDGAGKPVLKVLDPEDTKRAMGQGMRAPRAAGGGTYGGANTTPTIELNDYGAEALGNQGFIRRLFSGARKPAFGGLGAKLSNPAIGIDGAPSLLNLQSYRDLTASQKDATAELYESGLDVDVRDILERSRRAAPWGRQFGNAAYGF